jgi:hypothetical protein
MLRKADISDVSAYIIDNESPVVGRQGIFLKLLTKFAVH